MFCAICLQGSGPRVMSWCDFCRVLHLLLFFILHSFCQAFCARLDICYSPASVGHLWPQERLHDIYVFMHLSLTDIAVSLSTGINVEQNPTLNRHIQLHLTTSPTTRVEQNEQQLTRPTPTDGTIRTGPVLPRRTQK